MDDKVAIVTGSTSGVGLGVARHLANKACSVIVTGLEEEAQITQIMQEFDRCHKGKCHFLPVDLRNLAEVKKFTEQVFQRFPAGVDILINNAGIQHVADVETFPLHKWNDMLAIHLTAPFLLIQHFLPKMKEKGWGRIINMASVHSVIGAANKVAYTTTKHGLVGLTKSIALDAAEYGVTCNAICPGLINTPMATQTIEAFAKEKGVSYEEVKTSYVKARHPTGKLVEVEQIAEMVGFLCSSSADSITGSALMMDGGYTAR